MDPYAVVLQRGIQSIRPLRPFLRRVALHSAYDGLDGVRPLCYLNSEILVSIPEEDKEAERNTYDEAVSAARDDILTMLNAYPVEVWGDALGAAVSSLFRAKLDAAEISEEEKAKAAEG